MSPPMSRYQAFAIHLGISLLIFAGLAYLIWRVWFPDFLFDSDGGWQGMRIVIAVDLVLGPLLTLIVYRAGKPGLKFDLTMIGLFQASCLAFGVWIIHSERPVAIVYVDGSFYSVSADTYTEAQLAQPDWDAYPGSNPKWVQIDIPTDPALQTPIRKEALQSGRPLRLQTHRYEAFAPDASFAEARFPRDELLERDAEFGALDDWLRTHGGTVEDYLFYPYAARYDYIFLGFDAESLQPLGLLDTPTPLGALRQSD